MHAAHAVNTTSACSSCSIILRKYSLHAHMVAVPPHAHTCPAAPDANLHRQHVHWARLHSLKMHCMQILVLSMRDMAKTLCFFLSGILSTAPAAQQPVVLQRVRIVARTARQLVPTTFDDDEQEAAGKLAMMADLAEWVAGQLAGSAVAAAAAKLPLPTGSACPRCLPLSVELPSKTRAVSNGVLQACWISNWLALATEVTHCTSSCGIRAALLRS